MRKALYMLGDLKDEDIVWLASVGQRLTVPGGKEVIRAGQPLETLFLVIDGSLQVTVGKDHRLAELGAGDILGEMSLVEKRPPAVGVSTLSESRLLAVPHAVLREELARNEGFAARFYRALAVFLSDRLRGTVSHLGYRRRPDQRRTISTSRRRRSPARCTRSSTPSSSSFSSKGSGAPASTPVP